MSTYYVHQGFGNDGQTGVSPQQAFQTLTRGLEALSPGDTLIVGDGTYAPQPIDTPAIIIRGSGAIIDGKGTFPFGFLIRAPHVAVQGFEVRNVKGGAGIHAHRTHHVLIQNNKVHDIEGTGIFAMWSDYITIDRNEVFACDSDRATSAISIFQPQEAPGREWWARLKVTNNHIHHNGSPGGSDDFAFIYDNNPKVPYLHRLLVEGNLFHNNAKGMLLFNSDNFIARKNVGYHNGPVEFRFRNSKGIARRNTAVARKYGVAYDLVGKESRVAFQNNV